ncbi:MAG: phosphate signaling complex protein PhoU [Erysipelotrichia bacterium]|jgi:phosphate transport system protein|nr:phosphate signaling complex protein PhoU [Erysipelotrichia bacterium]
MKLDDQITQLNELILLMAYQVRMMMTTAVQALVKTDHDKALYVVEQDAVLNHYEVEVNEIAIQALSLLQPVAKDLRTLISAIKIANELERIGDYAKNIARYVIKKQVFPSSIEADALDLINIFLAQFEETIEVLKQPDANFAYQTGLKDEILDKRFIELVDKIELLPASERISVATIGILRNVERAGDHSKNVCEHIIYRTKSQFIDLG